MEQHGKRMWWQEEGIALEKIIESLNLIAAKPGSISDFGIMAIQMATDHLVQNP